MTSVLPWKVPLTAAVAWLHPFDVVVEQTHHRFDITRGKGFVTPLDEVFVVVLL